MVEQAVKQYLFVSNRDMVVNSILGHAIAFKRGEPVHVPKRLHSVVMERGAIPVDAKGEPMDPENIEPVEVESKVKLAPEDGEVRAEAILEVIKAMVERNNAKDFTSGGVPSATSVTAALGWKVDGKEIRPVWDKFRRAGKE